jgi:hypothetical protein
MTALNLVLTQAGMARFTAAQLGEPIDLTVAAIGLTAQDFYAAPTLTALPGEFRRVVSLSGAVVGDNIAHIVIRDDAEIGYTVRGFGLFLPDGVLLAAYGQPTPIVEKSPAVTLLMPLDLAFPTAAIDHLTFGNANFLNPPATTTTAGIMYLATLAQANAGDTRRATTGAVVRAMIAAAIATFQATLDTALNGAIDAMGQALAGLASRTTYGGGLVTGGGRHDANQTLTVTAASGAELRAGVAANLAVTPKAVADAGYVYVVARRLEEQDGYRAWSDGYIEQWGYVAGGITDERAFNIVFPIPFVAACFGISGTARNTGQSTSGSRQVQEVAVSLTGATVFLQSDQSSSTDAAGGFRWFARGR